MNDPAARRYRAQVPAPAVLDATADDLVPALLLTGSVTQSVAELQELFNGNEW